MHHFVSDGRLFVSVNCWNGLHGGTLVSALTQCMMMNIELLID